MTITHSAKGLVWIDLQSPTEDEISGIVKRYGLHPIIGEQLRPSPSTSKVSYYKDYLFVVLNFPARAKQNGAYKITEQEIDFVIGKNFLITSHSEGIEQLEYFAKIFETNTILNKDSKIDHPGHLFYYMVMKLYAGVQEDIQNVRDSILLSEEQIFAGEEQRMVRTLSDLSRELIDFRESARVHHDVWEQMIDQNGSNLFGDEYKPYIRDIRDEFVRLHELIQNSRELINDLRETNDSLLNTKQSNIIKSLTIINFIFIPATFISALFTIPATSVPLLEYAYGWQILFGSMIVITALIWIVIKKKKWL